VQFVVNKHICVYKLHGGCIVLKEFKNLHRPDSFQKFLVIKTNRCTEFQFYWFTTLHVSGSLSAHHLEFLAVHRVW